MQISELRSQYLASLIYRSHRTDLRHGEHTESAVMCELPSSLSPCVSESGSTSASLPAQVLTTLLREHGSLQTTLLLPRPATFSDISAWAQLTHVVQLAPRSRARPEFSLVPVGVDAEKRHFSFSFVHSHSFLRAGTRVVFDTRKASVAFMFPASTFFCK
jgi:hypothetical protein